MNAPHPGEPASRGNAGLERRTSAFRPSRGVAFRRRAWTAGAISLLVVATLSVLTARIAADRRTAVITADLEQLAESSSWPHQEYLRPRIAFAREIVALLDADDANARPARRIAAAGLGHFERVVMLAYRGRDSAASWTLQREQTDADVGAIEKRLETAFRANPKRVDALAADLGNWGRTLVLRFPIPHHDGAAVVEAIALDPLYENLFSVRERRQFLLQIYDETGLVWGERAEPRDGDRVVTRTFPVADQRWTLRAWPRAAWLAGERQREWWAVARVGLGSALLVALGMVWLMMRWGRLAHETEVAERGTRLVVDNALDAVVSMDAGGVITGWNAHAESTFGWSRKEAIGRLLAETIVPPQYRTAHADGLVRFLADGTSTIMNRRIEITAWHRAGREFPVELSISAIRVGDAHTFTAFVRDITDRKQTEEDLRRAKESAEASNRAKSEFLATMSHEIRTPMNGVFGMTELALDTADDGERRDFLQRARACAESLMTIINDILDFSKIEAGKLDLEFVDFDLHGVLNGVLDTLAIEAGRKQLELVGVIDHRLPPRLRGDPGRLRQVILNLGSNALKFTEHGEVVIRIDREDVETPAAGADGDDVHPEPADGAREPLPAARGPIRLRCSVRDSGIGIPRDKQQAIFESFTQADSSTTRRYGGTGLGLAISQRLVALMSGEIGVDSEPGCGSTFWFTARFDAAEPARALELATSVRGLRVLVVDDNATNRMFLLKTLQAWRCRPALASGGIEACDLLKNGALNGEPFDVVLLDMQMPDLDGVGTARRIRAEPSTQAVPIIALTSISRNAVERHRELHFAAALPKPIKQAELLATITQLADGGGAADMLSDAVPVRRILVVDDNEANRIVAQTVLRRAGYDVHLAIDGKSAIAAFQRLAPDMVLMDVQMPEMDGVAATEAIRAGEDPARRIPILALTAAMSAEDRERCLGAGMNGYVIKPMRREQLLQAVTAALAGREESSAEAVARNARIEPPSHAADNGIDAATIAEISATFLDDAIERCRALHDAVASNEATVVQQIGHYIKGGAAQLEIQGVRDLAAAVEALGRSGKSRGGGAAGHRARERDRDRAARGRGPGGRRQRVTAADGGGASAGREPPLGWRRAGAVTGARRPPGGARAGSPTSPAID